jgi:hypothetical protein
VVTATSAWLTGLAIPALLAIGAFAAWAIRSTIEDYRAAERELTAERRTLYQTILAPYLLALQSTDEAEGASTEIDAAMSEPEYRRAIFDLTLYASDDVVRVFGDITNSASQLDADPQRSLVLWARLLLAIRKSVGNKGTQLGLVDVLRPTINDLDAATPDFLQRLRAGE